MPSCFYDLERWKEAGREYRRVVEICPRGERSERAAYNRVMTADSVHDCGVFEDRIADSPRLPACAEEKLAAYDMYLQHFGETSDAVKIRYQRGVTPSQYFNRAPWEASDAFAEIVLTNEPEELASFAAVRLLEVLTESGRSDEARRWARKLKGMPGLVAHLEVQGSRCRGRSWRDQAAGATTAGSITAAGHLSLVLRTGRYSSLMIRILPRAPPNPALHLPGLRPAGERQYRWAEQPRPKWI